MLPASTNAAGMCTMTVPDVCKTPTPAGPIPMPYPNIAQCALAVSTALKVMISNRPVIHKMSKIPLSSGDEAGSAGGVVSNVFIHELKFIVGSTKVMIEGQQCEYYGASTFHNGTSFNTSGNQTLPSQVNVLVAP